MEEFLISHQISQCPCNSHVIRTRNSIIEEVYIDRNTGYVTISYGLIGHYNVTHIELVTLVISRDTIIQDRTGRDFSLSNLRKGMVVDADFSSAMTFSIPPQSRAYKITVVNREVTFDVTIGRVLTIDPRNGFIVTGNTDDLLSQIRFLITYTTLVLDWDGDEIPLRNIRPGQMVRIEHSIYQTRSIPPQSRAFVVQII